MSETAKEITLSILQKSSSNSSQELTKIACETYDEIEKAIHKTQIDIRDGKY